MLRRFHFISAIIYNSINDWNSVVFPARTMHPVILILGACQPQGPQLRLCKCASILSVFAHLFPVSQVEFVNFEGFNSLEASTCHYYLSAWALEGRGYLLSWDHFPFMMYGRKESPKGSPYENIEFRMFLVHTSFEIRMEAVLTVFEILNVRHRSHVTCALLSSESCVWFPLTVLRVTCYMGFRGRSAIFAVVCNDNR